MNGVEYLLDTNFILGMLKSAPDVVDAVRTRQLKASQCAFSAVTRMELLGFPGITPAEESLIRSRLGQLSYLPIEMAIEDRAIALRRTRRVKLPDAIIAATTLCHGLELLSLDADLQTLVRNTMGQI